MNYFIQDVSSDDKTGLDSDEIQHKSATEYGSKLEISDFTTVKIRSFLFLK